VKTQQKDMDENYARALVENGTKIHHQKEF